MPFTIQPLLHEDINEYLQVWYESFEPEAADQIMPMIYPQGLTPELLARLRGRLMNETNGDTIEYCFCARDDETKKIVGLSWWKPLSKPSDPVSDEVARTEVEEQIKQKNFGPPVPGANLKLGDAFYRALYDAERRTIKSKKIPYVTLNVLGVHPDFERKGAGSQLLEHGLQRVDSLNVTTWLVASSKGRGLYLKHDFTVLEEFDMDCTKYGGRSPGKHCVMIRPPQNS